MEIHKEAHTYTQKETNTKTQQSIKKENIQSNFEKKRDELLRLKINSKLLEYIRVPNNNPKYLHPNDSCKRNENVHGQLFYPFIPEYIFKFLSEYVYICVSSCGYQKMVSYSLELGLQVSVSCLRSKL